MKNKIIPIVQAVIAAFSLVAVNTFLHPCRGEMAMKCQMTTKIGSIVLAAMIAVSAAELLIQKNAARRTGEILSAVLSAALFFVPQIGSCGSAMMHCNTHTMPAFRISALLLFAVSVIYAAADIFAAGRVKLRESV